MDLIQTIVAEAQGQRWAADRYKGMGQEVITTIANHIDHEELRTGILATTDVRRLFPTDR